MGQLTIWTSPGQPRGVRRLLGFLTEARLEELVDQLGTLPSLVGEQEIPSFMDDIVFIIKHERVLGTMQRFSRCALQCPVHIVDQPGTLDLSGARVVINIGPSVTLRVTAPESPVPLDVPFASRDMWVLDYEMVYQVSDPAGMFISFR